jgi:hypothetical protein
MPCAIPFAVTAFQSHTRAARAALVNPTASAEKVLRRSGDGSVLIAAL